MFPASNFVPRSPTEVPPGPRWGTSVLQTPSLPHDLASNIHDRSTPMHAKWRTLTHVTVRTAEGVTRDAKSPEYYDMLSRKGEVFSRRRKIGSDGAVATSSGNYKLHIRDPEL